MKKNDRIVVTIEDIGVNGEGIGKVEAPAPPGFKNCGSSHF